MMSRERNFVGYEYKEVTVKDKFSSMYADGYESFGWQLEGTDSAVPEKKGVTLKLKRDRKIANKAELTRLQQQFEACMNEIITLENSKIIGAAAVAYIVGVIGTAFMAGSVFAYIGGLPVLSIILVVPGLLGWIVPYLIYCKLHEKKTSQVEPLINQKYDEIYQVCEKASALA